MTAASTLQRRARSVALNAPCAVQLSRIGTPPGFLDIGSLPVQLGMPNDSPSHASHSLSEPPTPTAGCQDPLNGRAATAGSARQSGLRVPDLPAAKAENMAICTASSAKQCRSNPVSGRRLPKTGIFQMSAGDYRLCWSENAANRNLETGV
jgi:hypothetical protein